MRLWLGLLGGISFFFLSGGGSLAQEEAVLRIGVLGASNTVEKNAYGYSAATGLRELCGTACEVTVVAKSGYSPQKQMKLLLPRLLKEGPIDLLVVFPSANGILNQEKFRQSVVDLVATARAAGVDQIAVAWVGPRSDQPRPQTQDFNRWLTLASNPSGIDFDLNIHGAVVDPEDQVEDDPYSGRGNPQYYRPDHGHYNLLGHRRIAVSLYFQIFEGRIPLDSELPEYL